MLEARKEDPWAWTNVCTFTGR